MRRMGRPGVRMKRATAVAAVVSMATVGLNAISMPAQAASASPSAAKTSAASAHATTALLSAAKAAAQAKSTGKPVVASALTTAYEQIVADPTGGYTLTQSADPVRALKNGSWAPLNADLARNGDGTLSPTTSTSSLRISGGGTGALATLDSGGQVMSLRLPVSLPKPTVSGDMAVYSNVIPGVDVDITVSATGAFSDTFVVHDAAAAADPRLKTLLSSSVSLSKGLAQSTDAHGNITVSEHGHAVFNAPAPYAWDSAATPAAGHPPVAANTAVAAQSSAMSPAASSVAGPGRYAHLVQLGVSSSNKATTLTEPASLFKEPAASYPIMIDPWYTPSYGANGWASFGSAPDTSGTNRWNTTPDIDGDAFVGNTGVSSIGVVWSAFNFQIPDLGTSSTSNLVGATVNSATFGITSNLSGSCPGQGYDDAVNLFAPNPSGGVYLQQSNATYNYWSAANLGGASKSPDFGGSSSCSGSSGAQGWSVKSAIQNEISSYHTGNQTFVLRADDENDVPATKRFPVTLHSNAGNPVLTVQFDKAPSPPTGLTISSGHGCGSTIGDGSTNLEATAKSPMGGQLTTTFDLYTNANPGTNLLSSTYGVAADFVNETSGQPAVIPLSEATLNKIANNALTPLTFKAETTDNTLPTTAWSSTCSFTYDPTRPGSPTITPAANGSGVTCYTAEDPGTTAAPPVGTSCEFTFAKPPTATISGYIYQVDQQQPVKVTSTGSDTITVTLPQIVNTMTVNALSAGGNIGQASTAHFTGSDLSPAAPDGSIANDGEPDLAVSGGSGAFPSGLWLTQTHADGTTGTNPVNVGTKGLGFSDAPGTIPATDWNGAQVISGDFCGLGAQDVMAYFPSGNNAGGGAVDCSDGSTDALTTGSPLGGTNYTITSGTFQDGSSVNASGVANAYHTSGRSGTAAPDLFANTANGLYLFTSTTPNGFANDFNSCGGSDVDCDSLSSQASPDGTAWSNWEITSAESPSGTVDMYLWNPTSGALVLWTNVTLSTASGAPAYPNATSLSYTSYTITSNWNTGGGLALRAGFTAGHTIPSLWATDIASGQVTSVVPTALPVVGQVPTGGTTGLTTPTHSGQFQDMPSGTSNGTALASTKDIVGGLTYSGSAAGAVWHLGDIYNPDAMLNTASDNQTAQTSDDGVLTASGSAVSVKSDFSVAVSVRPNTIGGTVLSQSGTNTAGFTLGATTGGQWQFCLAKTDAANAATDCATGGTVQQDVWATLTATYSAAAGSMQLYVDGTDVAGASHAPTTATTFTGAFLAGAGRTAAGTAAADFGGYYSGQVAAISAWNVVAPPPLPATAGSAFVPVAPTRILDTRSSSKIGSITGPVGANSSVAIKAAGVAPIPSTGVTAIAATITAVSGSGNGVLIVYPDGTPVPNTSNIDYSPATVTNGVTAALGPNGEFDVYNAGSTVQLIVDVTGYFTTNTTATGASTFNAVNPFRILDTRNGTGGYSSKLVDNAKDVLTVGGLGGVPSSGVTAVELNLTVTDDSTGAILAAYADGASTPTADTAITSDGNATVSTASIIPVGADGKIDIYMVCCGGGSTDVVADIAGYFTSGTTGQFYHPVAPNRLVDTRQSGGALGVNSDTFYGDSTISAYDPTLVTNVTTVESSSTSGLIAIYPAYDIYTMADVATSTIDYSGPSTLANFDLINAYDATGQSGGTQGNAFQVFNTTGTPQLIVDVSGFFAYY